MTCWCVPVCSTREIVDRAARDDTRRSLPATGFLEFAFKRWGGSAGDRVVHEKPLQSGPGLDGTEHRQYKQGAEMRVEDVSGQDLAPSRNRSTRARRRAARGCA